eukprot:5460311-Alexandrium_andersonii.AAC.1
MWGIAQRVGKLSPQMSPQQFAKPTHVSPAQVKPPAVLPAAALAEKANTGEGAGKPAPPPV